MSLQVAAVGVPSCCALLSLHPPLSCRRQNPEAFKVAEDIQRLSRRIKSGEKDVAEQRRKAHEQAARVAALREQLEALEDAQVGREIVIAAVTAQGA